MTISIVFLLSLLIHYKIQCVDAFVCLKSGHCPIQHSFTTKVTTKSTRIYSNDDNSKEFVTTDTNIQQEQQQQQQQKEFALLFDCDGVILETEELHRIAYNRAFEYYQLKIQNEPVVWSVEYYDILQNSIGGGKPKMFFHFRTTMKNQFPSYVVDEILYSPPLLENEMEQKKLIDMIQEYKTNIFQLLVQNEAQPRPGIVRLMDEAFNDPTIAVGVCSASTKEAALTTLQTCLGFERIQKLDVCILGDDVDKKKPDPLIYITACQKLGLQPNQCIVIEDSVVGLKAALAAQMKCIITYTSSTAQSNFYEVGAAAIVPDLNQNGYVTIENIFQPIRQNGMEQANILEGIKDPM